MTLKTKTLNLLDFEKVDALLEGFNQSTGFVTAILDLDGNILSKSGWRQVCTEFHRIHPETSKRCTLSDTILAGQLAAGEKYHFYKCMNGLIDVAVPVVIKGEHIANLFSGQFFFEEPDEQFFREQAKKYGFEEDSYLNALRKVPVIPEEKVKAAMEFLLNMTQLISEITFQKVEQVELNEVLRTSEERYRLVLENSMDGILLTLPNGTILSANQAACTIFQRSEEEICHLGKNGIIDMSDPRLPIMMEERNRTGKAKGELLMFRKDGTKFPVELTTSVYTDPHGQQRTSMIIRDITERKQTEVALKLSEEKFNKAFHNSPDAIIITNASDGEIIDANETFFKLSGYKRDLAIGSTSLILNLWYNTDERTAYITSLKNQGSVKDFEAKFITSSGEVRDFLISGELLTINNEYCILAILRDITERKLTEENIKKLNRVYTVLSSINQTIIRTRDQQQLFNEACRIAVDKGEFLMVWIGLINTTTNKIDVVASYGKTGGYLNDINIDLDNPVQSSGPTGMAVKTGKSIFSNNIETDDKMIPWREKALKHGFRSSITLPFKVSGKIIAAYTMYSSETDFFNEDEIKLLEEMASDISYALEFIESEQKREQTEEELEKNNALLQSIIEGTSDVIYIKDTVGKYLLFNKAAELITGKKVNEVLGKDDTFLFSDEEANIVMQGDLKIITKKETSTYEEYMTSPDGKVRTFLSTKGPIFNRSGNPIGLFGVARDITDRKLAEDALIKAKNELEQLHNNLDVAAFSVDLIQNKMLYASKAHQSVFGHSPTEFLENSQLWYNLIVDEDKPTVDNCLPSLANGKHLSIEYRIINPNRQVRWIEAKINPTLDENGNLSRIDGIAADITQRKRIEVELLESETNFRRSISDSPMGIRIVTVDGKTIFTNKTFLDIFELKSMEEFISKSAKNRYTPESYAQHEVRKEKRKNGQEVFDYEISLICCDEKIRHLKVSRKELLWNGTKHFQVINLDITEQRNAEEQLRKLSKAVEQSPNAVCITNPDGIIEYINPRTIQLTGFSAVELINENVKIFSSGEKPKEEYAQLWQTIKSGNVWSGELHNKKKNGELYWESTSISPIFDTAGQITHFLAIKEDVTDRKRAEIALNKSEEQLRKFASHLQNVREEEKVALAREIHDDLGQILVALKIDMGLLKQKVVKNNSCMGSEDVLGKFDNLVSLIDKTIKTARRIMNGLRPEQLEIMGFEGAVSEYIIQFKERHQLSCEFIHESTEIELNPQQALALFRILQEALNNIVKHAKASSVKIKLSININTLILKITDNGIGFDKNRSGRQDSYGMIGMKERIVLLNGKIDITSEVDKGTCVCVEIPYM